MSNSQENFLNPKEAGKLNVPVVYETKTGNVELTADIVRDFLVSGRKELVTFREVVWFMHTCKARKLNPFISECYLVKYSADPAAIITSREYYEQVAMEHDKCLGYWGGIVVLKNDGSIDYREGEILLEGETLVGGWAETEVVGWKRAKRHTVQLEPYIKKTKEGKTTKFWHKEKQPHMISKVAEVQLLRNTYGDGSTRMYTPDELPSLENVDYSQGDKNPPSTAPNDFDKKFQEKFKMDPENAEVIAYIDGVASHYKQTVEQVKEYILSDETKVDDFTRGVANFQAKRRADAARARAEDNNADADKGEPEIVPPGANKASDDHKKEPEKKKTEDPEKKPEKMETGDPVQAEFVSPSDFVNEWLRLHNENFEKYMSANYPRFKDYPQWVLKKAREKYEKHVGEWPFDRSADNSPDGGDNTGKTKYYNPETDKFFDKKPIDINGDDRALDEDEVDVTNTDEWLDFRALNVNFPDITANEMLKNYPLGTMPKDLTLAELRELISAVDESVENRQGGSGGGIPEA